MVRQTTPDVAAAALAEDPNAVYLDVRMVSEFESGHPKGAINVPVVFFEPPRRESTPNDLFSVICDHKFPKSTRLFVGCQSGARSLKASEILQALGFTDVTNVDGGYGGRRDNAGRTIERGWVECGLPVERGSPAGRGYEEIKRKFIVPMPSLRS